MKRLVLCCLLMLMSWPVCAQLDVTIVDHPAQVLRYGPILITVQVQNLGSHGVLVPTTNYTSSSYFIETGATPDALTRFQPIQSTGGGSAVDLVKGALDSFDGLGPRLTEDPNVARLVNRLPSGIIMALFLSCAGMEDVSPISGLVGCAGAAASVELLTAETLAVNILVGFGLEGEASAAAALVEQEGISFGSLAPQDMAARLEGPLLAVRLLIDTAQVAQVIDALIGPQ